MFQDLRFGLRMLRKHRGLTAVAVTTLALGIGANTAIFSVVNGVMLKSLPFREPDRLLVLHEASQTAPVMSVSYPNLCDWQQQQTVFEHLAAHLPASMVLTGAGEPERFTGRFVTANFFATLGAPPALGRPFTEAEDKLGGERAVILSHRVWQRHFGGDPQLIGRPVQLSGNSHTVVGVMPADFDFYGRRNLNNDLFLPLGPTAGADYMRDRGAHPGIYAVARLKPEVAVAQARAEMKAPAARLAREYPKENADHTIELKPPMASLLDESVAIRRFMLRLVGLFALVALLLGAGGIYGVMAHAVEERTHEIGIRMALGAQAGDVVKLILRQGLVPVLLGIALGLAGALALTRVIASLLFGVSATDPATFTGLPLLLAAVALLACWLPARRATKVDPLAALRHE